MIEYSRTGKDYLDDLTVITFEPTYLCDKKCPYCYNPIPRSSGATTELKDNVWKKIMNIDSPKHIIMLGGETTFFENSINYFNEFSTKYMNDNSYHMTYFTHGNNKPEVYQKFIGGKKTAAVGFSYHNEQTDLILWLDNMKLLIKNNVQVVVCILIQSNYKGDWEEKKNILETVTKLGAKTQLEIEISNTSYQQNVDKEAFEYFHEYVYRCFKIKELVFKNISTGEVEILLRDDYFKHFPQGLSASKKMCKNQSFRITPDMKLSFECHLTPPIDLTTDLEEFENYIKFKYTLCKKVCTGISSTLNNKKFFESNLDIIKEDHGKNI